MNEAGVRLRREGGRVERERVEGGGGLGGLYTSLSLILLRLASHGSKPMCQLREREAKRPIK